MTTIPTEATSFEVSGLRPYTIHMIHPTYLAHQNYNLEFQGLDELVQATLELLRQKKLAPYLNLLVRNITWIPSDKPTLEITCWTEEHRDFFAKMAAHFCPDCNLTQGAKEYGVVVPYLRIESKETVENPADWKKSVFQQFENNDRGWNDVNGSCLPT